MNIPQLNHQLVETAQKMKFSITGFFSKGDQIRRKLWIWSHLLKKSVMESFIFCAVGTFLYKNKRLSYQLRNDLRIYDPGKIESTFKEVIRSKSTNVIVGGIYKHPTLPLNDFTN